MPFPDLTSLRHESLRLACLANHCLRAKDQAPRSNREQKAKIFTIEGRLQPALQILAFFCVSLAF